MLAHRGTVYFSNADDGRVHTLVPGATPEPLTPVDAGLRYADFEVDARRDRLVCVVEDHRGASVVNDLRAIPLDGGEPISLVSGNDFYSTPRVSPDGTSLLWLTWNQPNMPWDGCELWVARLDDSGMPRDARLIAGGAGGVDLPAVLVSGVRRALHVRQDGVVEPLPVGRCDGRGARADAGRMRRRAMGVRAVHVCVHGRRADRAVGSQRRRLGLLHPRRFGRA